MNKPKNAKIAEISKIGIIFEGEYITIVEIMHHA